MKGNIMTITKENIRPLLKAITDDFAKNREELCGYDRAIGDGDHGDSMARGTRDGYEAVMQLPDDSSVFDCIKTYSRTMLATIGGAIGPIFSTVIMEFGRAAKASGELGAAEYAAGLKRAAEKVMDLGGAKPGDKTLVDALVPAAEAAEANSGKSLGETLLTPTKIYVKSMLALFDEITVKGIAHITGGGFIENIPRILPEGIAAEIEKNSYEVPPVFKVMQKRAGITDEQIYNTFNMGIGMVVCVAPENVEAAMESLQATGEEVVVIGKTVAGTKGVILK